MDKLSCGYGPCSSRWEGIDGLIQAEMHSMSIDVTPPPLKSSTSALPGLTMCVGALYLFVRGNTNSREASKARQMRPPPPRRMGAAARGVIAFH
ncbi:hypothetical protein E2C01_023111 [Portunus trituberculatus]|uniref:Uncharacterized protein n=1 Tax=Portunus trituberculatus TaxID=210409 RepID=A0A5B7E756_PORTR|nr:hypothetical protein [Portunus trituberculatus]